MKILVVDDQKINRTLPCVLLRQAGCDVEEVESGEAALAALDLDLGVPTADEASLLLEINAWFGLSPRSLAESVSAAVSPPNACAVNEGTFCDSATRRSGWPIDSSALESRTTTGAGLS